MATRRITVSVPAEIADRIKQAAGTAQSISEWVTNSVTRTLEEEAIRRRFLEFCASVPATRTEEKRARASFEQITRTTKTTRAKRETSRGKSAA